MKKYHILLSLLLFVLASCATKEDPNVLSYEEQKAVVSTLFNFSSQGMQKGMQSNPAKVVSPLMQRAASASYPLNNDFSFTLNDSKGGSVLLTIDTGGYFNYSDNPFSFLGGVMMINIKEKINNYHVSLPNGREVILSTSQDIVFSGNFTINGNYSFDAVKSFFRIEGTYFVNGIGYEMMLMGAIKADGTCGSLSGLVNGLSVNYEF